MGLIRTMDAHTLRRSDHVITIAFPLKCAFRQIFGGFRKASWYLVEKR